MRLRVLLPVVFVGAVSAQTPANPGALKCDFDPFGPVSTFSLHYEAGYAIRLSDTKPVTVSLRLTAAGRQPIDLQHRFEGAEKRGRIALPGGNWRVEATAVDDAGRSCRGVWRAEAKTDLDTRPGASYEPLNRLTVFLQASPADEKSPVFRSSDFLMLTGSLASVVERLPAKAVRVVVFQLELERELFRTDELRPADLDRIGDAINAASVATVDYSSMRKRTGAAGFVAALIDRELAERDRSDAVIFLGPLTRSRLPAAKVESRPGAVQPRFFDFRFRTGNWFESLRSQDSGHTCGPEVLTAGASGPSNMQVCATGMPDISSKETPSAIRDTISQAVGRLRGKTVIASNPYEFAQALERIAAEAHRKR